MKYLKELLEAVSEKLGADLIVFPPESGEEEKFDDLLALAEAELEVLTGEEQDA
tara:strand:+ start:257 stop:418 length:162 start_codon:yes stop_codon:yes gene_type:complete